MYKAHILYVSNSRELTTMKIHGFIWETYSKCGETNTRLLKNSL